MTRLIAALDNSLAAKPVLSTALALGRLLGASVEPLHIGNDGDLVARTASYEAGLELHEARGPVVERLIEVAADRDVAALVLGARGTALRGRLLGSTALAVATSAVKPVVVVPPDLAARPLRRVLVPVEAGISASFVPQAIVELARGEEIDVVVLHVHDESSLPAFTDQPQHEHEAWTREFLRRYCPWGIGGVRLEVRVGARDQLVPLVAEEVDADLIALGWSQQLAPDRAPVVRATLERARVPVMLVPVKVTADTPSRQLAASRTA